MKIEMNFIGIIACLLLFLSTCILEKTHSIWFDKWKQILKVKKENLKQQKICTLWNFICFYIVVFISSSFFLQRFLFYIGVRIFHNARFFSELGACILCFLLGILFSNGKKILEYIVENYSSFLKSFSLVCVLQFLLRIYKYCISQVTLLFSLLYCICIIHYIIKFQKRKNEVHELEFIFQFLWILIIQFINSFILIYCLWNL